MDFQKPVPLYFVDKGNIMRLIFFTAAFALVFINFYNPFGVERWNTVTKWGMLLYSSLVILTGVLVVVASRISMFYYCKKNILVYWQYFTWVLGEVFFMALFYAIFQKFSLKDTRDFDGILKVSVQNTALVLLLPYSALWLFFSWREKKQQLDLLTQGFQPSNTDSAKNMIPFHDEKGVLRFSVKNENLLYLEAADNYVNVYYLNKEKVNSFLLRNSLKNMEEVFKGSEIIRCHRSYMVNFDKIKVIRKDKDGLKLEFDLSQILDIPVSKSYAENVMDTFSKFCRTSEN
jgi:hypothetical protein